MDSRFSNKTAVKRLHSNMYASNPREYSAGLIATFSVSAALVVVRILSGVGFFSLPAFSGPAGELLVSVIWPILGGFILPVCLYFMLFKKGNFKEKVNKDTVRQNFHNFGYRKMPLKFIIVSIGFGIFYSIANQGIAVVSQNIMRMLGLKLGGGSEEYGGIGHLFIMLFTSALLPTICEETVDRGILVYSLKKKSDIYAIVMSAAIFAFTHMNIAQTIYTFMLGLIAGYVVVKTGNIIPGMIVHFINNAGGTLFSYLYVKDLPGKQIYEIMDYLADKAPIILIAVWLGALALAILLARFLVKQYKQESDLKRLREQNAAYGMIIRSSAEAAEHNKAPDTGTLNTAAENTAAGTAGNDTASNTSGNTAADKAADTGLKQAAPDLTAGNTAAVQPPESGVTGYTPYKPGFRENIFLYATLVLNVGATLFSIIWALM